MVEPMPKPDPFQKTGGSLSGLFFAFLPATGEPGCENIFHDRKLGQEMVLLKNKAQLLIPKSGRFLLIQVRNIFPANHHRAACRREKGPENIEQSRLATSRRPDHSGGRAFFHRKIQVLEHLHDLAGRLKIHTQFTDFDHGGNLPSFRSPPTPHSSNIIL